MVHLYTFQPINNEMRRMPVYLNACMYCMTVDLESWQVWRLFSRDPHRHYPRVSQVLTVEFRHRHLRTLKKKKLNLRNCVRRQPYTLKPRRKRRDNARTESRRCGAPFIYFHAKYVEASRRKTYTRDEVRTPRRVRAGHGLPSQAFPFLHLFTKLIYYNSY